MSKNCGHEIHSALRANPEALRSGGTFVGIQDDGVEVLELWNCACGGTIAVAGVGPGLPDGIAAVEEVGRFSLEDDCAHDFGYCSNCLPSDAVIS